MHNALYNWAADWSIPGAAIPDLLQRLGVGYEAAVVGAYEGFSEAAIQQRLRSVAAHAGIHTWRNNVGAYEDSTGRWVRYGLCNDTKQLNERVKSADLIGIKPVTITPAHIGTVIGQFWSREVKEHGWTYGGTKHEVAQLRWIEIVTAAGGDAAFTTGKI